MRAWQILMFAVVAVQADVKLPCLFIFGLRPSGIEQNKIGGILHEQLNQFALLTGLSHMH